MHYKQNPKTAWSGIICGIPQTGTCPIKCADCFFQSGRSYLEPLEHNLPNMPSVEQSVGRVVRINDGNDSNNNQTEVIASAEKYEHVFFNTCIPRNLEAFKHPVVLTVNPGKMTDTKAHLIKEPPINLMFVRARVNTWNLSLIDQIVEYYTDLYVPVVLTYMAYYTEKLPSGHESNYTFRKRTLNSYWVINPDVWDKIYSRYDGNPSVHTCGKDALTFSCKHCGTCLREYFATKERISPLVKEV